jgi:RimJ/RimL family protein N-acetyltransferase
VRGASEAEEPFLFYAITPARAETQQADGDLPPGLRFELWRPSLTSLAPRGARSPHFLIWWAMHALRMFGNRDYAQLCIYEGDRLIHRSGLFPRSFRFRFMAPNDLQIGDTWTDPDRRGRGLATAAIRHAINLGHHRGRRFWYIVDRNNAPSIRAVERAGFLRVGKGVRVARYGFRLFGEYVLAARSEEVIA